MNLFLWGIRLFTIFVLPGFPNCFCIFWALLRCPSPQTVLPLCCLFPFFLFFFTGEETGWVTMDTVAVVVVSRVVSLVRVFDIVLAAIASAAGTSIGSGARFFGCYCFWWSLLLSSYLGPSFSRIVWMVPRFQDRLRLSWWFYTCCYCCFCRCCYYCYLLISYVARIKTGGLIACGTSWVVTCPPRPPSFCVPCRSGYVKLTGSLTYPYKYWTHNLRVPSHPQTLIASLLPRCHTCLSRQRGRFHLVVMDVTCSYFKCRHGMPADFKSSSKVSIFNPADLLVLTSVLIKKQNLWL